MDEAKRIEDVYGKRNRKTYNLYSQFFALQREIEIMKILKANMFCPLTDKKILDIGCGRGAIISLFLREGVPPENLSGIDILNDRIRAARSLYAGVNLHCGNATRLPYPENYFDIVTQATMFTSILDLSIKIMVASEMHRVLKDNGVIIWHDFRFNNPLNNQVCGIGKKEIMKLFPGCRYDFKLMNLNPFIARYLIRLSESLCNMLERVPLLCTHWMVAIRK